MAPVELPRGGRVLLRLPNWLGDVVLCSPGVAALRKARPDLALTALVKPSARAAAEGLEGLGAVLTLSGDSPGEVLSDARRLREGRFDAAVIFPKGLREALLAWRAGIPVRTGLATDHRSALLTHPVAFDREAWHLHHARQFASVLGPLGVVPGSYAPAFAVSADGEEEADAVLAKHGVGGAFAVFHVAASKAPRAWHGERFGRVAAGLREEAGLLPVLVGTSAERSQHAALLAACPGAVDLAGETTLMGMAGVLRRARLFVGNDSGPMHVAAAVGTPVAAVFGPGAAHKTAPQVPGSRIRVVSADLPCSPCRQAFWKECRPGASGKPPCLEGVSAGAVLAASLDLLARSGNA